MFLIQRNAFQRNENGEKDRQTATPTVPLTFFRTCRWLTAGKVGWENGCQFYGLNGLRSVSGSGWWWAESKDMRRWACRSPGFSSLPCSQHFPLLFYNMNNFLRSPFHSNRCHFREKCTPKLFNLSKRSFSDSSHTALLLLRLLLFVVAVVVDVVVVSSLSLMTIHLYFVQSVHGCVCARVSVWARIYALYLFDLRFISGCHMLPRIRIQPRKQRLAASLQREKSGSKYRGRFIKKKNGL